MFKNTSDKSQKTDSTISHDEKLKQIYEQIERSQKISEHMHQLGNVMVFLSALNVLLIFATILFLFLYPLFVVFSAFNIVAMVMILIRVTYLNSKC